MKLAKTAFAATVIAFAASVHAAPFAEGFDNVSALGAAGWVFTNLSTPVGTSWTQGDNTAAFASQAGAPNAYAAANFLSASNIPGDPGSIDNWLITPEITLGGPASLSFYARTFAIPGATFGDTLQVLFSSGSGAATGGFVALDTILLPTDDWTLFTYLLPTVASGRVAFRYLVVDANNANYVGLDTVSVQVRAGAIPEPGTYALMGLGLVGIALARRSRRAA